jgi:hypothetical protein
MQDSSESSGATDEWVVVPTMGSQCEHVLDGADDKDPYQGVTLMADKLSGKIVFLSTRKSRYVNRWTVMPSVEHFKDSLVHLDLYNSRHIHSLDESIGDLLCLKRLMITRCTSLKTLPDSLGRLSNLEEVRSCHPACVSRQARLSSNNSLFCNTQS